MNSRSDQHQPVLEAPSFAAWQENGDFSPFPRLLPQRVIVHLFAYKLTWTDLSRPHCSATLQEMLWLVFLALLLAAALALAKASTVSAELGGASKVSGSATAAGSIRPERWARSGSERAKRRKAEASRAKCLHNSCNIYLLIYIYIFFTYIYIHLFYLYHVYIYIYWIHNSATPSLARSLFGPDAPVCPSRQRRTGSTLKVSLCCPPPVGSVLHSARQWNSKKERIKQHHAM